MSKFDIKSQVKLPLSKCMEVVLSGIQFRLFRASITMAIIALAVAFLMTILGDSMIVREVAQSVEELVEPRQNSNFWVRRLSRPLGPADIGHILLRAQPAGDRWAEFREWGEADNEAMAGLQAMARDEDLYLRFFADLPESQLRPLVGRVRGRDIFSHLSDAEAWTAFLETLPNLGLALPREPEEFQNFLRQWRDARPLVERIGAGHAGALSKVTDMRGNLTIQEFLAESDADLAETLRPLGFRMRTDETLRLRDWARQQTNMRRIEQTLQDIGLRQRFAGRYGIQDMNRVVPETFFGRLASRSGAEWLVAAMAEIGAPLGLTAETVRETATAWLEEQRLANLESSVQAMDATGGFMGFSTRILWLIGVSLIVCVVGIANAMLMSVTERFKEIATMKCLGATDGFIMTNFIMESGFQGLAGGLIGGLLGLLLGIVRAALGYGWMALTNLPGLDLLLVFAFSVAAGVALSVLAAIYPALAAARLAPLEAMRVE